MTTNNKGRNGWHRATQNTSYSCNHIAIKSHFKAMIVGAACWGLLPVKVADGFIQRVGVSHD